MPEKEHYRVAGISVSHSVSEIRPDQDFPLHMHDSYEIYCFVSGNVKYVVEGRTYLLSPGSLMLIRSAESHRPIVEMGEPYERYVVNFRPEILMDMGIPAELLRTFTDRELGERNQYLPSQFQGVEPLGLIRQMFSCCEGAVTEAAIYSHLTALLCATHSIFANQTQLVEPKEENRVGRELLEYINGHLTEDISLSILAEHVHMSPSQINRVFKRVTGTSVYHYIVKKRLIAAQERIIAGEGAVSASQKCGFRDYSSFFRLYKKQMGVPPTAVKPHQ